MIPIIDTHQHLWDLERFRVPWTKGDPLMGRSYLMSDYLAATADLGVVKSVYMEVDVDPQQQADEASYVLGLCQRREGPLVGAVISGRPGEDGFRTYVDRFRASPYLKGVRRILHGSDTPPGHCLQAGFVEDIRFLGERGLSFDICIRPTELSDAAKLVDACPKTRFILDHCGNANVQAPDHSQWKRDLAAVSQRPNVVVKVSGIVASAKPDAWSAKDLAPLVDHVLDSFGPQRVMFGGDWPVCTKAASYRQWVEALRSIVASRSEEFQRRLFHDNALAFYRLA